MVPSNKFLSPTCAPNLGDIATYFFFEKIFRFDTRICVTMASLVYAVATTNVAIATHIAVSDRNVFDTKSM